MYSLINEFQVEKTGKNCLYSAIQNVLNYQGLSISEAEVFFAFGGLDLRYHKKQNYFGISDIIGRTKEHSLTEYISIEEARAKENNEKLNDGQINKRVMELNNKDHDSIVLDFYHRLEEKKPVVCLIQVGKLSYLDTPEEMKTSRRHTCVLYGLNTIEDKAYIADAYRVDRLGNITVFMGEIPLSELISALCGYFTFSIIKKVDKIPIESIFKKTVEEFLHPLPKEEYVTGYPAFVDYIKHLKHFEEDNKLYREKCFEAGYLIKITSIQPYLSYFTEILPVLAVFEENRLKKLKDDIDAVNTLWEDFRVKLIRDSFRDIKKRNKELLGFSEVIMDRQRGVFEEVCSYIRRD